MEINRRSLLSGITVLGGVGFAGCSTREGDDSAQGLARIEVINYDTDPHTLQITLMDGTQSDSNSSGILIERSITLPSATVETDSDRTPVPTDTWISDFPEQTEEYVLKWSIDGKSEGKFEMDEITGCKLLRVEINEDEEVSAYLEGTVDCYGPDE